MEGNVTETVARLVLQLGVILIVAKIFGEIVARFLRQPPVLGELLAGAIIGPYALGGLHVGPFEPLFSLAERASDVIPVSTELYGLAQIAAVVLLFVAGMETDLKRFLRYAPQATVIAVGGVAVPFILGDAAAVIFGFSDSLLDPEGLFLGAVLTATSVGITARVLSDLRRLDSPEGVTILGAAVVDDVLGILILAVVVGVSVAGTVQVADIAVIGVKAIGFWVVLTGGSIIAAPYIARVIRKFRASGAELALAVALAFLAGALAEGFGLAMIIGAYSMGLALSTTDLAKKLEEPLSGLYHALVPVFFAVMGMLVDVSAMTAALGFGLLVAALAIVGKIVGAGLPAFALGFNKIGSWRVGVGMVPRGEVGLIIAGIGVASGTISLAMFGVAIMTVVLTTFLTPLLLVPLFRNQAPGLRRMPVDEPMASRH